MKVLGIVILLVFYSFYLGKIILQKRKGIKTDQIAKGKQKDKVFYIELIMKIATYAVVAVEVISIFSVSSQLPKVIIMIGAIIALAGDVIFGTAIVTMKDNWRAGLAEEDKTEMVTAGIYKFSRNPAFLGFDCVYIGLLLMFFNWALLIFSVFAIIMLHLQILQEENYLPKVFGEEYIQYKKRVCRYIGRKKLHRSDPGKIQNKVEQLYAERRLIGQGNTAEIFAYDTGNILKLYRYGMPDELCAREFSITKYVYEKLKIAPQPIEEVIVEDRVGALYEQVQGITMLKKMLTAPWKLAKYSKELAQYQAAIHIPVDIDIISVKEKLKRDIVAVTSLLPEEKQNLFDYLDTLPDGNTLCHFDFHPDNIMISAEKYYVIDWMTGCQGDRLADIARTKIMLNYAEIPRVPNFVNVFVKMIQKTIYKIYLKEYIKLTKVDYADIERWELPVAAARLCEWIPEGEAKRITALMKKGLKEYANELNN